MRREILARFSSLREHVYTGRHGEAVASRQINTQEICMNNAPVFHFDHFLFNVKVVNDIITVRGRGQDIFLQREKQRKEWFILSGASSKFFLNKYSGGKKPVVIKLNFSVIQGVKNPTRLSSLLPIIMILVLGLSFSRPSFVPSSAGFPVNRHHITMICIFFLY